MGTNLMKADKAKKRRQRRTISQQKSQKLRVMLGAKMKIKKLSRATEMVGSIKKAKERDKQKRKQSKELTITNTHQNKE